ncbi:MAG: AhpC/TSA family protein [Tannerella sp.]|jgi:thiol-disulfide isomerase/thioredoxin|nr:AhpC/TSA family protein [Tannerella sp.]
MKRISFIVISVCAAMLVVCCGKNEYVLNGIVPDGIENGEVVYMTDYNDGLIVDSAVISGKKFVFKGVADSAMARSLTLGDLQANIILEKGTMTVDMADPYSAKGNLLTEKMNEFLSKSADIIEQAREKLAGVDMSLSASEQGEIQDEIVDDLFIELNELPRAYLKEHSNDALGAMVFYTWMQNRTELSEELFNEACKLVGENVLNFGPIKQMAAYYDKLGQTAAGMPFVDFTIDNGNSDGSPASLSDYVGKGKYVLVDFWASWCKPCRLETPVIAEVYNKYKGDLFDVVSVAVWDQREATLRAIEEDGNAWPQILDAQAIPTELYGIQGIPHIILFGPDGTILARNLRGDNLKNKVAEVLGK